jgi:glutamine cyclotransferase
MRRQIACLLGCVVLLAACSGAPAAARPTAQATIALPIVATARATPTPALAPTAAPTQTPPASVLTYTYEVVNIYPHDPGAFTQGLIYTDGVLYESTGLNGRSSLRRVALETGEVLQKRDVAEQYFAEGLTLFDNRLIQLTWQNRVGFVYDKESFEPTGTFSYTTEGWGITHDGSQLIMSDGSAMLRFLDPQTFEVQREVQVTDNGTPVVRLNELEYVNGEVWANVWQTDLVARVDPQTGRVLSWIDLSGLLTPEERASADVLNGIAYDSAGDRLFVTGKLWPKLFEIRLIPAAR